MKQALYLESIEIVSLHNSPIHLHPDAQRL